MLESLGSKTGETVALLQEIGIDPVFLLHIFLVTTIWLGCACWASSIAESRGYGGRLHFVIGLLLPVFYPPILLVELRVKRPKNRKKKDDAANVRRPIAVPSGAGRSTEPVAEEDQESETVHEHPDTEQAQAEPDEAAPEKDPEDEPEGVLHDADRDTFRELHEALREFAGLTYLVSYGGHQVEVLEVLEAAETYASVRIRNDEGEVQRLRIPYARVTLMRPVWNNEDTE